MSVATFKRMVLANDKLGMTELAARGVTQHGLSNNEAMGLLRAWRKDGTVKEVRAEPTGPGSPKVILTGA